MIDKYISKIKKMKYDSRGTGKLCYTFDDVVLLETTELISDEMITILNKLDKLGIKSYKVLEQKQIADKVYILETKVKGTPIQEYGPTINEKKTIEDIGNNYYVEREYVEKYLERLNDIASNKDLLKKFVQDYMNLIDLNIFVDPSKTGNFYFDSEDGYSFLDLQVIPNFNFSKNKIMYYIFYNISWCYSNCITKDEIVLENNLLNKIVAMLRSICNELGIDDNLYCINFWGEKLEDFVNEKLEYRLKYATIDLSAYIEYERQFLPSVK